MRKVVGTAFGLFLLLAAFTAYARQSEPNAAYYIADDANGVQQVYQQLLALDSEPRQLTHAENDVMEFGVAFDGLSVAYISGGRLWLQPLHTEEAEALASVSAERYFSSPVYSQDGQYIAYADNGVWLLDLATRSTRQILADVPVAPDGSNMPEYRLYRPEQFVLGAEGTAAYLVLDVGIWEWSSAGVYDLATGKLTELEGQNHTSLLPLMDGRVLIYGNTGIGGEGSLAIADSLDDINAAETILYFSQLTEGTLFATQAAQSEPDSVRIFGQAITLTPPDGAQQYFYFDLDLTTNTASEVQFVTPADASESENTVEGELAPNGSIVPIYVNTLWTEDGVIYGGLKLVSLGMLHRCRSRFRRRSGRSTGSREDIPTVESGSARFHQVTGYLFSRHCLNLNMSNYNLTVTIE
ncbi:MAG: hypothetical protein U0670_23270 [Anaerolineae bacterium]